MSEREWRFYIDDMLRFAEKVRTYTTGIDRDTLGSPTEVRWPLAQPGTDRRSVDLSADRFNGYGRPRSSRPGSRLSRRPAMKIATPLAAVNRIHVDEARLSHRQR